MTKTPTRRKSIDSDDPFTPLADRIKTLPQTPSTSRQYSCPLRVSPGPSSENGEANVNENISPSSVRKRTSDNSTITPLQKKNGIPLMKRSSMSKLADGFRSAACLANEGPNEEDPFMMSFRQFTSISKSTTAPSTSKLDPTKCLTDNDMSTYKSIKNLKNFYDWQVECLGDQRLLNGQNCILSLPTGAGKTLIAEILMLREAIVRKRNAILVLPYVAIVQEKITSLAPFEEAFGISIEEYAANKGRFPPINRRKRQSIYVATIEKANMLINSLIDQNKLDTIGLVVVDELHMIGDGNRGATMEQLLAKFLFKGKGQIVGMSATLPNLDDLQMAMRAYIYKTDFRPVALSEFVKIEKTMYSVDKDGSLKAAGDLVNTRAKTDPDGICSLLERVIPSSSAVVFCPNKKNCENVAVLIAKSLPSNIRQAKRAEMDKFLQSSLANDENEKIDQTLRQCLLSGVAYHHSGLTQDERKCVEAAFMEGLIYVVCATSTLAAGVNLPVRRVIIKAPMVGREKLGKAQYLQMAGRAGRAGFDTKGDCITIVRKGEEERWFRKMLQTEIPRCVSALISEETMSSFLLDLVSLKMAENIQELLVAMRFSLIGAQESQEKIEELVGKSLERLKRDGFVTIDEKNIITPSDLGCAVFNAGFAPEEATQLHSDLASSLNQGIIFSSHFHLLFIITPYEQACNINWDLFLSLYNALPQSEKVLLGQCGLKESFILEAIRKRFEQKAGSPRMRLYIALMLQKIWNHEPMFSVAERFEVEKGWLQATLQSSISQAASIAKFAEKINGLWPLRQLLPELVQRLSEAAQPELIPLMAIDGVKKSRAALLYNAGFRTVAKISRANVLDIQQAIGVIRRAQAQSIITNAKNLLRDRVDEKLEELDVWGLGMDDF